MRVKKPDQTEKTEFHSVRITVRREATVQIMQYHPEVVTAEASADVPDGAHLLTAIHDLDEAIQAFVHDEQRRLMETARQVRGGTYQ